MLPEEAFSRRFGKQRGTLGNDWTNQRLRLAREVRLYVTSPLRLSRVNLVRSRGKKLLRLFSPPTRSRTSARRIPSTAAARFVNRSPCTGSPRCFPRSFAA